jgi:Outer membrane protein beta-barrel domain
MKKIFLLFVACLTISFLIAQDTPEAPKKKKPADLSGRANDHFLIQLGYTGWAGIVDSIHTGGLSKSVNVYFMMDFPFKTNPKLSVAIGAGVSTDQIKFKKTYVGIKDQTTTLRFTDQSDTNHFKRTKLATAYLEAPIEFRFTADPANSDNSFKFAIGVKVGTMINAHTRNKDMQTASGSSINQYTMKESSKRFFNTTRLSAQARVGYGHFSLYGTYQITNLFKDGVAPAIRPYSIGLTLSGL